MNQYALTILFFLLVFVSAPAHAARQLQTFDLVNADPEQVVQVIKQYLTPGSSVNSYQNKIIVNASESELENVRGLLRSLDATGRSLWIAVRVGNKISGTQGAVRVETQPVISNHNGVRTETRTSISVSQRGYSGASNQRQGVRATEGHAAYISTGVSVPISQAVAGGQRVVSMYEVNSGFYATVWVSGNAVNIELDQQNNQYQNASFNTQQLQSRVSGELGVWIPVGVVAENQQQLSKDILARGSKGVDGTATIYVKVELDN